MKMKSTAFGAKAAWQDYFYLAELDALHEISHSLTQLSGVACGV